LKKYKIYFNLIQEIFIQILNKNLTKVINFKNK